MLPIIDLHQDISLSYFDNFEPIKAGQLKNFKLIVGASCALKNNRGRIIVPKNPLSELIRHLNFYRQWIKNNPLPKLILSIEGLYCLNSFRNLFLLDFLGDFGVKIIAPVWNINNNLVNKQGLTRLGREMVKRCNQLGIILDGAHASSAALKDILRVSRKPIIISHALCKSVHNHPRNLDDKTLKLIKTKSGLIGLTFVSEFSGGKKINQLVKHFIHCKQLDLINNLAVGSDFGALAKSELINGLEHPGKISNLVKAVQNNFPQNEINKIFWQNANTFLNKNIK